MGSLSRALGGLWRPYAAQLLDAMTLTGLSPMLVDALTATAASLPELLPQARLQLAELITSHVLRLQLLFYYENRALLLSTGDTPHASFCCSLRCSSAPRFHGPVPLPLMTLSNTDMPCFSSEVQFYTIALQVQLPLAPA